MALETEGLEDTSNSPNALSPDFTIEEPIANLCYVYRQWADPDTCLLLLDALRDMDGWITPMIGTPGGLKPQARRVMAFSDSEIKAYEYNRASVPTQNWDVPDDAPNAFALQWVAYLSESDWGSRRK